MLVDADRIELLLNDRYIRFLRQAVDCAQSRILVLQFLIDVRPQEDEHGEVRHLLNAVTEAASDGLDVRLLVAQVLVDHPISRDMNDIAVMYLRHRGADVRQLCDPNGPQQHIKAIMIDDNIVIAGSHNWTPSAFRLNEEASLAIWSRDSARIFAERFNCLWGSGRTLM